MSQNPELNPGSLLRCIRDALEHAQAECPYHGTEFHRSGFWQGEPRCDSCRQPWRISRARLALDALEADR